MSDIRVRPKLHLFTDIDDIVMIPVHNGIRAGYVYKADFAVAMGQAFAETLESGTVEYDQEANTTITNMKITSDVVCTLKIGTTAGGDELNPESDIYEGPNYFSFNFGTTEERTIYFTFSEDPENIVIKLYKIDL